MTATAVLVEQVAAPPLFQCPNPNCRHPDDEGKPIAEQRMFMLPHATVCRLCGRTMQDVPFCWHCRTYTAPVDAHHPCPNCGLVLHHRILAEIGHRMNEWAEALSASRPPPSAGTMKYVEKVVPTDLPIRIKTISYETTTSEGVTVTPGNTVVEYDVPLPGIDGKTALATQTTQADSPLGLFLKQVVQMHQAVCEERDKLKAWKKGK